MVRFALKVRILVTLNYCLTINIYSMKNRLTKFCRLISERISKCFKKSQNKKPTIVKNKMGFKLNFGFIQFERSKEWSSLSGENAIPCGDAGSSPALHSFLSVNPSYFQLYHPNKPILQHHLYRTHNRHTPHHPSIVQLHSNTGHHNHIRLIDVL